MQRNRVEFQFRKLNDSDLEIMFHWLQLPHVKEWWNDGDDIIEKVAAHYFDSNENVERFIFESEEGKAVGYFQCYSLDENVIGIDQFIGDNNSINVGIGSEAVKKFTDLVLDEYNPNSIVLDPDPNNARAIRCYEKAGFKFYQLDRSSGQEAYMMRLAANA